MKKYLKFSFPNSAYEVSTAVLAMRRHTEYASQATSAGERVDHDAIRARVLIEFADDDALIAYAKTMSFAELEGARLVFWRRAETDISTCVWSTPYDEPVNLDVSEDDGISAQAPLGLHYSIAWQDDEPLYVLRSLDKDKDRGRCVIFVEGSDDVIESFIRACEATAQRIAALLPAETPRRPKYPH